MIQNRSAADRKVVGNLSGSDIKMGVADLAHLLNVLTDLYSDRELACIREYSTNALDAHIEAGVTSPIEVTTPTALSPLLVIRDFGIGLTVKDIEEIYSQYGASTKRNTNSQTGMLGLGCKSALTYSDQFTVTSVKDGVRIQVVVSRNAQGASMKVVDTASTADPNGTTVAIPAKAYNSFELKAKTFFRHWKPGTVKLNGAEPRFMEGAQRVTDQLYLRSDDAQSFVVMGGVPYPAVIQHDLGWRKSITAFVDIGEVDFAPSREGLMDTDTTTATLQRISRDFKTALSQSIADDIASAKTPAEAARKRIGWLEHVPRTYMPAKVMFKGKEVPDSYQCERETLLAPMYYSKMNSHSTYRKDAFIPIPSLNGALWVTGFDYAAFTATVRKKLDKYVSDNAFDRPTNYVLTKDAARPDTTWLSNVKFIDWPTIKAIKLPRDQVNPRTGRIPGSYDLFDADQNYRTGVPGDDIDADNDLFWVLGSRFGNTRAVHQRLLKSYPDCTLVMLRSGREGKFQRLFPDAQEAKAVVRKEFDAWKAKINKTDALALYMQQNGDSRLAHLDTSRLRDPAIARVKAILGRDTSALKNDINEWAVLDYRWYPEDENIESPLDKYVLLPDSYYFDRFLTKNADHVYDYMNHIYEQESK